MHQLHLAVTCLRRLLFGLLLSLLAPGSPAPAQTLALRHYTTANGLPQTIVYALCQDRQGQLWVGTQGGVASFDGRQFYTYDGRQGLPDNHVRAVAAAPDGTIWLGHEYGGVSWLRNGRIHPCRLPGLRLPAHVRSLHPAAGGVLWVGTAGQGLARLRCGPRDTLLTRLTAASGLPTDSVSCVKSGPGGQLWVATTGGLVLLSAATGRPLPAARQLPPLLSQHAVNSFFRVSDTLLWCATPAGLVRLSRAAGAWRTRRYTTAEGLCDNQVLSVVQDRAGKVWATTAEGLCRAPAGGGRFTCFAGARPFDSDQAHDLLEDREGSLWIVDDNGLGQHLADERFTQFGPADGLPDNEVHAILKMGPGEYWVGTRFGLVALHTAAGRGRVFDPVPLPGGPAGHFVRSLLRDRRGGVWVGTLGEGALRYNPDTRRWTSYNHGPGLHGQRIASIAEDQRGRIWLATRQAGVTVFDPADNSFRTFDTRRGLPSNSFWKAFCDHRGRLWLGSDDAGLIRVDTEHDTFRRVDGQPGRLSIGSISEDRLGTLWLGSIGAGLLRYEPGPGRLRAYGLEAGLQTLNPYFAQCDSAGRVWLGTNRGLDCFTIARGRAVSYGVAEGFAGSETNQNAVLLDQANQLWVGTVNGLMHYNPALAHANRVAPQTRLTGLRVAFEDTVLAGGAALPFRLNSLAFDYVGVSLTNPAKVRYCYRLAGFDDDAWTRPLASTTATYTNLPPGAYTFEVKAANNEGVWNARPASFAFTIRPPWWRTWWAYLGYAALFGLTLYGVRANTRFRERQRADRELERQALNHLQEIDRVKTDFFTNVSHEFRTPLTLILGPAEELATEAPDPGSRERGGLVLRNARKLLSLINQLLDLSKLEAGALRLQPSAGDLGATVRQLLASFESLAESRQIRLIAELPNTPVPFVFDAAKLEEVLTNLLANALRFTPAGGQVTVALRETAPTVAAAAGGVRLAVRDTGPGIEARHLPRLFDRFYQAGAAAADGSRSGTGIGLALVRELTELHGGTVEVQSTPGAGASFTLVLPRLLRASTPAAERPPQVLADAAVGGGGEEMPVAADAELVLIIEDNEDVRRFIRSTLAPAGYRLLEAPDGLAGLAQARAEVPDLVVSDVMMPGLDGYELCRQLKTDPATSHIPVVLLTARSEPDAKLEGLETGADSFLAKPFNPRELRAQVRNLLALHRRLQARFDAAPVLPVESLELPPAPASADDAAVARPDPLAAHEAAVAGLPSLDQAFLRRVSEAVLRHLDDEQFGVDQLGSEVAMSRTQVHRKLKALTGQSPGEYIRVTRLHRALALLRAQVGTVAEVSYQVGFGSPTHFSTAFSRYFGYPPSAVAKQLAQG